MEKLPDPFRDILPGEGDPLAGAKLFEASEKRDPCAVHFGDIVKIKHDFP